MASKSCIELRDLQLNTLIGTYKSGDVVPDKHILDLTLWLDSSLILIDEDAMDHVFDYDPLIHEINNLAGDCRYETQEYLLSRIVEVCAQYQEIESLAISLSKSPVRHGSGKLGIRLEVDASTLTEMRSKINDALAPTKQTDSI